MMRISARSLSHPRLVRAGHKPPPHLGSTTWEQQWQRLDHLVVNVSWRDTMAYVKWLGELSGQSWRLPTEAEWEKTACWDTKANHRCLYPWGDAFDKTRCNTSESGIGSTTPVGRYPNGASPYGVLDLAGNVREWTSSIYKAYPYNAAGGREAAQFTQKHVMRGGGWDNSFWDVRAAYRNFLRPDLYLDSFGFRLVCAVS